MTKKETISKSKMYSDAPIKDAERFNFKAYSDVISEIILNKENNTPFSIMINGKWGRGKTTLMRTIREKLIIRSIEENTRNVKSVWFNAWKYSETDQMLAALVLEIFEEMEQGLNKDKVKSITVGSKKEINLLKAATDIVRILGGGIIPDFGKWVEDPAYKTKLSFYDLFQNYMKTILETFILEKEGGQYNDKKGVLVILIDDLDRCSPKQITKVFESINLFFDQEGCFFIIGADISLISKAIEFEYKDLNGFSGIDYVKKMIQLQFDLPTINNIDIIKFVEEELKIETKFKKYFELITAEFDGNPREIKRFVNSLNLMRMLGESIEHKGYKEELLIKWSILSFYSKDFFEEVTKNPEFLIELQEISMMKNNERANYIKTLNEEPKRFCSKFIKDETIVNLITSGEKFESATIQIYIFLSSVAPNKPEERKEIKIGPKAYLVGENLSGRNLPRENLQDANLEKSNLQETNLEEANLKGTNLNEANLEGTNLRRANLQGANLRGANLEGANLHGANFEKAEFDEKSLTTILKSNWRYATFDSSVKEELEMKKQKVA